MNYALVGAFVLTLAAALIAGVLWIVSGGAVKQRYDPYLAIERESVAGLNLNAPVKYNGVEVGKVQGIQLDPNNPEHVRLTLAIEHGTPIKEDTVAVLKVQGLTGIAYIELGGGTREAPALVARAPEAYPVIRTRPSLGTRLENVLTAVLAKLDRTSVKVDALLSDANLAALKSSLADIATVAHAVAERKDTIDAGIVNASRTFDQSARVAAELGPVLDRIGRAADSVDKMGRDVALAGADTAQTVAAVGGDVHRFANETRPELQRLLGELEALSTSLRRLSEQTARDPAGLLRGRGTVPPGPGESTIEGTRP